MAFKPRIGKIITENCEVSGDFAITGDILVDGSVRLSPDVEWISVNLWGFPDINWSGGHLFDDTGDLATAEWYTGDDPTYIREYDYNSWWTAATDWPRDYVSIIGREQTANGGFGSGEVHEISSEGASWDSIDNTTGWTTEFTFYVPIFPDADQYPALHRNYPDIIKWAAQGAPWYLDFDDGTKAGRIWIDPFSTLFVPNAADKKYRELTLGESGNAYTMYPLKYYSSYTLSKRTLRLTVKGDEVWISCNSGITGTIASFYTSPSASSSLVPAIGSPTGLSNGSVYGPNGSIGFIVSARGEVPPSQRVPQDPPSQKYSLHLEAAGLATTSGTKKIGFYHGILSEQITNYGARPGVIMLDTFYVKAGSAHEGFSSITFDGDYTTYTAECQPVYPVSAWNEMSIKSIIPDDSGDTYLTAQYYDGGWQDLGSALRVDSEQETIDLSSVPVTNDLEDRVRLKIRQVAAIPSGEPPRIDYITVSAIPISGDYNVTPTFGPTDGENWVTLEWVGSPGSFADAQPVYVGNTVVPTGDITHVDTETKLVKMPAKAAGDYFIKVVGSDLWSVRPYTYANEYDIEITTGDLEEVFGNTRSPWRVLSKPPKHSINLAFVGSTPLDTNVHMSLVNLSDREPSNLTGYGVLDANLYNGISGDFLFEDAVDTADVLISNVAATRRELDAPSPLYYKHLIGRDRYYLQVSAAVASTDLEAIRSSITVYEEGGVTPSFAWDIIVTNQDYYGEDLPDNVYCVVLLTEVIPANTMWVSYRGVDRLSGYTSAGVRREIINPVPLFGTSTGRMNMHIAQLENGSYNIQVET